MKTSILLSAILVAAVLVAGCTSNSLQSPKMIVDVSNASLINAVARSGYKYIGYNCTVKNVGSENKALGYNIWELRDSQGGVYYPILNANASRMTGGNWFGGATSEPGDIINGVVIFEVPQNVQVKSLTYDDGSTRIVKTL